MDKKNNNSEPKTDLGQKLIDFSLKHCKMIRATDGRFYVTLDEKPHIAFAHSSVNSDAVSEICSKWFQGSKVWPNQRAASHLSAFLTSKCRSSEPVEVFLRAGIKDNNLYLDCGDPAYSVYEITPHEYRKCLSSPVLFTRSHVISELPPIAEGNVAIEEILRFIRIEKAALPSVIGCMIASWMPNIPQPIVFLQGPARSGKTTSLRKILSLIDPSTDMPGGSLSNNESDMKALASLRRVFVFDNVSHVDADKSDLLARVSSGGEIILRAKYTDDTAHVTQMRRPVYINGIMDGFTRSDLASRAINFNLFPISEREITADSDLNKEWNAYLPFIFTRLLGITQETLRVLNSDRPISHSRHRNIDLVQIIDIVGNILGIDGLAYLEESIDSLSSVVLSGNVLGEALRKTIECSLDWEDSCDHFSISGMDGETRDLSKTCLFARSFTSEELRTILKNHTPIELQKELPDTPKKLGEGLKRIEADLLGLMDVQFKNIRTKRGVKYEFSRVTAGLETFEEAI